ALPSLSFFFKQHSTNTRTERNNTAKPPIAMAMTAPILSFLFDPFSGFKGTIGPGGGRFGDGEGEGLKFKCKSLGMLISGIDPVRELFWRFSPVRRVKFWIVVGMLPVKELKDKSSKVRKGENIRGKIPTEAVGPKAKDHEGIQPACQECLLELDHTIQQLGV
ncbi:unnamed protein product, partial [Prunus brigantina]